MEKLSEKQTPDFVEMRKTLVGLGNVLIQAGLAEDINCRFYPTIKDFAFQCGKHHYEVNSVNPYDEESYNSFVESIKDFMRSKVKDYEEQIFALECSKAVIEVYFSENK